MKKNNSEDKVISTVVEVCPRVSVPINCKLWSESKEGLGSRAE